MARIGARYADLYPERVRAFVLDGALDLELSSPRLLP
jgi:pimeloyl-ACP methyl ester carboxylesterase